LPRSPSETSIPPVADWFQNGFHRFLGGYLKRHFHAIAVDRTARPDNDGGLIPNEPVIVFGNHPSWWDPLIGHFLNHSLFGKRQFFAPIDSQALQKYKVFGKLGFFGVDLEKRSGASEFLSTSQQILARPDSALWITPEGRFTDARDASETLMPGLSHLCHRHTSGCAVAMALEYVFWDERSPVCLARFSKPIALADHSEWDKSQWNDHLTEVMRENQRKLAVLAIARDSAPLDNLISGKTGAGGIYDLMRRSKSWVTGKSFQSRHGSQF
jgi:1-acyl-sn-glycerol-3-phosphate acyltransferase